MSPIAIGVSMVAKVADAIGDAQGRIGNTHPLSIDPTPQIFRQFSGDRSEQLIDSAVVIVEGAARHAGDTDDVVDLRGQAHAPPLRPRPRRASPGRSATMAV